MKNKILSDLKNNACTYDLGGVEFTEEDISYVEQLIDNGIFYDDAIEVCLLDIYRYIRYIKPLIILKLC
jgi:hypothetical protein